MAGPGAHCAGIRLGRTPIHHLASGNPGTPLGHAQTETLLDLCLVTQQVCSEARPHAGLTPPVGGDAGRPLCNQRRGLVARPAVWGSLPSPDSPPSTTSLSRPQCSRGWGDRLHAGPMGKQKPKLLLSSWLGQMKKGYPMNPTTGSACHSDFWTPQRRSQQQTSDWMYEIKI